MSVLPILVWPDPRLSEVAAPVGPITGEVTALIGDMLETMYAAPGRGLAAPQVGILKRVFVMDADWKDGKRDATVCIDPEVLERSAETVLMEEACLSIPGIRTVVERPEAVRLSWRSPGGERVSADLSGALARIAQHELDHLDGRVTLDRLTPEIRAAALAEYETARA